MAILMSFKTKLMISAQFQAFFLVSNVDRKQQKAKFFCFVDDEAEYETFNYTSVRFYFVLWKSFTKKSTTEIFLILPANFLTSVEK